MSKEEQDEQIETELILLLCCSSLFTLYQWAVFAIFGGLFGNTEEEKNTLNTMEVRCQDTFMIIFVLKQLKNASNAVIELLIHQLQTTSIEN